MSDHKIGIVLLARMGSKRLPGKAMVHIKGKPSIFHLIERLKYANRKIVLATTELDEDKQLVDYAQGLGIEVYCGENDNPLLRSLNVAKKYEFDQVVRITHDDIFIDVINMQRMINYHVRKQQDYTYISLIPYGCGAEIIATTALQKAYDASENVIFEGMSNYFRNSNYKWDQYKTNYEYQHSNIRCTLDTHEDLSMIRIMCDLLPSPVSRISSLDIIHFLKKNRHIAKINSTPEVSIYIPNHNYAEYLTDSIESALAQTFENIEIIVVDDASTDNSVDVLKKYLKPGSKVKVFFNDENIGLAATSNKAIGYCTGKYIIRIDADDKLMPEAIKTLVEYMNNNENLAAVFPSYIETDEKLCAIREVNAPFNMEDHHPTCCLIKKRSWEDFKYSEHLKGYESYDFILRFKNAYKIDYYQKPLWFKRKHGKNMSETNLEERKVIKEDIKEKCLA